jgi:hypothetical protein
MAAIIPGGGPRTDWKSPVRAFNRRENFLNKSRFNKTLGRILILLKDN